MDYVIPRGGIVMKVGDLVTELCSNNTGVVTSTGDGYSDAPPQYVQVYWSCPDTNRHWLGWIHNSDLRKTA